MIQLVLNVIKMKFYLQSMELVLAVLKIMLSHTVFSWGQNSGRGGEQLFSRGKLWTVGYLRFALFVNE